MNYSRLSAYVHFSPWPIFIGRRLLGVASRIVLILKTGAACLLIITSIVVRTIVLLWALDIVWEAEVGEYSFQIFDNLKYRFTLFVLREIILFFSFLWALFHFSWSPAILIGQRFPPFGMRGISPLGLPLFNTALLLRRGVTVTWGHHLLVGGSKTQRGLGFISTIWLGALFLVCQGAEFKLAELNIRDRVLGRTFFTLTGLHGLHVLLGLVLLAIRRFRLRKYQFSSFTHVSLELSIWYWHLVDCVWLLVYRLIYWWGG